MRILFTIAMLLAASPAFAQDATSNITVTLTLTELVTLERAADKWPTFTEPPPDAYWSLRAKLARAVQGNPEAAAAFDKLCCVKHGR
ncbi:hypothetical protein QCM80_22950 [Bradyrhizobium sp. SSUT112]|nr:hypothetical protein [Bradyrhizobium sp. SSUT112]